MRNFVKVLSGLPVTPLLVELAQNADLWNRDTLRTEHPGTAHSAVDDILVMFNEQPKPEAVFNDLQTYPRDAWRRLPKLRKLVLDLMNVVEGTQLGRVVVTRLPAGYSIDPHVDQGAPATFYTRYQIALQVRPGALFHIGEETAQFQPGEIWLIDNELEHSVVNNSDDDRIVVIVDVRSA